VRDEQVGYAHLKGVPDHPLHMPASDFEVRNQGLLNVPLLAVLWPADVTHYFIISGARILTWVAPLFFSAQLFIPWHQSIPISGT